MFSICILFLLKGHIFNQGVIHQLVSYLKLSFQKKEEKDHNFITLSFLSTSAKPKRVLTFLIHHKAQEKPVLLQLSSFNRQMNYFLGIIKKIIDNSENTQLNHVPSSL